MLARGASFFIAITATLTCIVACRQVVGIDEGPPEDISGSCGLPYTGTCGACLERQCCGAATTCAKDPTCLAYETCFAACGSDESCRAKCNIGHHVGSFLEHSAIRSCLATTCEIECGLACGGLGHFYGTPETAQECQACLVADACDVERSCATDINCYDTDVCSRTCSTPDCRQACIARALEKKIPIPPNAINALNCTRACGIGTEWSCLGRVSWPIPKGATKLTFSISLSNAPLAGADIAICSDLDCTKPAAHVKSGADGSGVMMMPNGGLGGRYIKVTSPGTVPILTFPSYPITETDVHISIGTFTPEEIGQYLAAVSVTQDPDRGYITATTFDCRGESAPDVKVATSGDSKTQTFYFRDGVPSRAASATDASGVLAISNAPAGSVDLIATTKAGVQFVHTTVFVRPQSLTVVTLLPTP